MHEARAALRKGTAADHGRLDALFGGFRLSNPQDYRAFLTAHAMALTAVEQALDAAGFASTLEDWPDRKRGDAVAADLSAIGEAMPTTLSAPPLDTSAAQWGAAYVIEGSRLGGALLARSVPEGMPKSYLGSAQPPGSWRKFLDNLDKALPLPQDVAHATESARATFGLFEQAGKMVRGATD
ncbi:biliverdin-producing heme oxygenase [Sphingomonas sp. CGMCC 1.13654]|uniref:Biliverdin-producing heme oxygenase n=1 Tax=Sphingomonas chungangi TaxID=2683589 RepID=A0A838LBQ5_9SPHN|nr:biliverdin-producing heme oxygenase [Sphingomonas chungangi]MBA2936029.1 biliverdin-producing heme oxygenase [Sphingomonas chungangi]MVW55419.1 biliverdin-producing heme oxygenase [Sphingomonas chungangi]